MANLSKSSHVASSANTLAGNFIDFDCYKLSLTKVEDPPLTDAKFQIQDTAEPWIDPLPTSQFGLLTGISPSSAELKKQPLVREA